MLGIFIYFVIMVSFIDTMFQLPILAPYVLSLGASSIMVGLVMGSYSLVNMLGNLGAGLIIDRYGRKIAIWGGMLAAGLAVAFYSAVVYPIQLLGLRIIHGLAGAILVPAVFTYLGDRTVKGSTGKAMGYSGAAVGLAALVGPMYAGIGKDVFGVRPVFLSIGLLLAATSILVKVFLPESHLPKDTAKGISFKEVEKLIKYPQLQMAYLAAFALTFSLGVVAYSLPITLELLGFTGRAVGMFFSVFSFVAILVFILPSNRISDYYNRFIPIGAGLIISAAAMVFLAVGNSHLNFAFGMGIYGLGFGLIFPAMNAIIIDQTEKYYRGTAFGVFYAVFSLGVFSGPLAAGVARQLGWQAFYEAAAVLMVMFALCLYLHRKAATYGWKNQ
ncbi:MAG: MFS transporter [Bacillota bacterium]